MEFCNSLKDRNEVGTAGSLDHFDFIFIRLKISGEELATYFRFIGHNDQLLERSVLFWINEDCCSDLGRALMQGGHGRTGHGARFVEAQKKKLSFSCVRIHVLFLLSHHEHVLLLRHFYLELYKGRFMVDWEVFDFNSCWVV